MIKKYLILTSLLALFIITGAATIQAAPVQEAYQRIGNYDYIEASSGLRVVNSSTPPCTAATNNSSGTLSVSLPSGQSVDKAFLYWGGSRTSADTNANLQVNGGAATAITGTAHTTTFTAGTISLSYYLSVADITSQLQGNGENLTMSVSGMDTDGSLAYSQYCAAAAHMGVVVVHTTDNTINEPKAVLISHGLEWSRNSSITNTYSNLPPSATVADAKATIWAVEGDAGLAGGESLSVNGVDQGVIWDQGDNNTGRSLETHQVSPTVPAASTSLTWTASAGADLVLFPAFFTSWNVSPPILTKTFTPSSIQVGETSTLTFSINNILPGSINQSGIVFTDLLPANIVLASSPNLQLSNCAAATVTGPSGAGLAAGQNQIEVRDLSVNANQTCSISIDVTSNFVNVGTPNACGGGLDDAWTNGIDNITEAGGVDVQVTDICLEVTEPDLDYGDAPASYGDAWHIITTSPNTYFGTNSGDADGASQPDANAEGDDNDGTDDEDGTTGLPTLTTTDTNYSATLSCSDPNGEYYAWLDTDQDGSFTDETFVREVCAGGNVTFNWTGLSGLSAGTTFARFRAIDTNASGVGATALPTGEELNGEIEDYAITITTPPPDTIARPTQCGAFNTQGWITNAGTVHDNDIQFGSGNASNDPNVFVPLGRDADGRVLSYLGIPDEIASGFLPARAGTDLVMSAHNVANPEAEYHTTVFRLQGAPGTTQNVTYDTNAGAEYSAYWIEDTSGTVLSSADFVYTFASGGGIGESFSIPITYPADGIVYLYTVLFDPSAAYGKPTILDYDCPVDLSDTPADGSTAPDGTASATAYGEASHTLVDGIRLGTTIDADSASIFSADASGDGADDDSVDFSTISLILNQNAIIPVSVTGADGYLQAWIDWNGDGDFADTVDGISEQISINTQDDITMVPGRTDDGDTIPGQISLAITVPASAITSAPTFARLRWSTDLNLDSTTTASDGEVEDYQLTIVGRGTLSGTVFEDTDSSDTFNAGEPVLSNISVSAYTDNGTPYDISDDTLVGTTDTAADGSYTFTNLEPGTYRVQVDANDADLPANLRIGTLNPLTGQTVSAGNTTQADFGFDAFACVPGGGADDPGITPYISTEFDGDNLSTRNTLDASDDAWRTAAGLPQTGAIQPWLGYSARALSNNEPALFNTNGVDVDVALVNIEQTAPCLGNVHGSGSPDLSTGQTLQENSPRPASLYDTSGQPAFWNESSGLNNSPNAVRFTFATPVQAFGAWFGDLETRTDGFGQPAYLRLLDSSGNRIGADIAIEPTDIYSGGTTSSVDQNQCGSTASDLACGNTTTRWVGFVDSSVSARIKHALVIVGDDDFADDGGTERISFIGLDILLSDYGDAPASYGDAEHYLPSTSALYLGLNATDAETQSQHAANGGSDGTGDDNDGNADDDGVRLNGTTLQDQVLSNGSPFTLSVTANGSGRLHGWIDWDRNGVFGNNANELIISETTDAAGTRTFSITPPNDLAPGVSYARFRYSTDAAAASPTGTAADGEVEDYRVTLGRGFTISGRVFNDTNVDSVNDAAEAGVTELPVVLYDTVNSTCISTRTNANGEYSFDDVVPGDYQVYEASQESVPLPQNCDPANARDPGGYLSTTANASAVFTLSNASVAGIDFGDVKPPVFELDNAQTILPNTTALHPHIFTALSDGSVSFSIVTETANPATVSWGTQLLVDNNCDGLLDSGDTAMPASINMTAGQQVCILTKVLSPADVPAGAIHTLDIQSNFIFGNGASLLSNAIQTRQDITRSAAGTTTEPEPTDIPDPVGGEGKLSLVKSVWNATRGTTVGDNDGSVALPGETLQYTIAYENIGNGPLNELVITDSVPEFTQLVPASMLCTDKPAELPLCTANDSLDGSLSWRWTTNDKLLPGSRGSVSYQVVVE